MKHKINVSGIQLYAFHGCLDEEAKIGGKYEVDVRIDTDFSAAAENDTLKDTIDYVQVHKIVAEEMAIRSKLIETVGQRIFLRIKTELNGVFELSVKITKLSPPINGDVDSVAIVIED